MEEIKKRNIKTTLINITAALYRRIFHEEMSTDVQIFIKNLVYVGIGTAISTLFSTIFTVLGGRLLGPEEYGKFALIQSVAMFLYIPMVLGFSTAMLKYTSEKPDFERQSNIISTTYILVVLFTIVSAILIFIFRLQLSRLFSISPDLFSISLIFAILYVFNIVTTSVLRAIDRSRAYAVFQIVYAVILLLIFILFILNKSLSFKAMTYPMLFAYGINSMVILILFVRKYLKWRFDRAWAKILTKYALFAVLGGSAFAFYTNFGKILISRYMNVGDVGIYNAYYVASIGVGGLFWGVFNIVYFPAISKYENKGTIFKRINKLLPFLFGFGIPIILIGEFIILKLFGSHYPVNFILMLMFAVSSILVVCYGLFDWTFASQGLRGMKLDNIGTIAIAIVNALLSFILIPRLGLYGAAGAILISFIAGIGCLSLLKRRIS